jgi:hypothetical protein
MVNLNMVNFYIHTHKLYITTTHTELRFLQHPGIQDGRKNLGEVGRSGYNVRCFVVKLSIERIKSIKVDEQIM